MHTTRISATNNGQNQSKKARQQMMAWTALPTDSEWPRWSDYLQNRKHPRPLRKLVPKGSVCPLLWGPLERAHSDASFSLFLELAAASCRKKAARQAGLEDRLETWLAGSVAAVPDLPFALECLAWAHLLPSLAALVTPAVWRDLFMLLVNTAHEAVGLSLEGDTTVHALLAAELPLTLAYYFPELPQTKKLYRAGCRAVTRNVVELTDGEGQPSGRMLGMFRFLLASWTRCRLLARAARWSCWDKEAELQYAWTIQQAIRLTRRDGTQVLTEGMAANWCPGLFSALLDMFGDAADRAIARQLLPGTRFANQANKQKKMPAPPLHSEWAEICVMRTAWARKAPCLTTVFCAQTLRSELSTQGRVVWSGDCTPRLRVNAQEQNVKSDWRELCWFTDEDVDYLELQGEYSGDWLIQRQILLSRSDHFLLLADAILGPETGELEVQTSLPLRAGMHWYQDPEVRDGVLGDDRALAAVMPLALPQWTAEKAAGELACAAQQLQLTQTGNGQALYAAWFFDLAPARLAKPRTWRRLTVAAQRVVQKPDAAVGFRVQVGRRQWLIYRSLQPAANRSVLGQNLSQEFVAARFNTDGHIEPLIEIEASD